ncbi:acyltransferase [Lapidilactobacillus concavus]|nr:acyltransferase [Lapidilactobacillus concavus]
MRNIFIFGVLMNHTTSAFAQNMRAGSWSQLFLHTSHLMLHFTRMGFMFMTGLVLFLNYYHCEQPNWWQFWKKRYTSVGIPYLAWNILLLALTDFFAETLFSGGHYWQNLLTNISHGSSFYLYYVFVIFQLYLIFPVLVKIFRRFERHHLLILAISLLVQFGLLVGIKYGLPHLDRSDWPYWFRAYGMNIFVYQAYFVVGAYAAIHYAEVVRFLKKWAKQIRWMAAGLALGTVGLYFFNQNVLKLSFASTEIVHQPYLMIYALTMIGVVFLIGLSYAARRETQLNPAIDRLIKLGSKISFGIYLSQTIPLMLLRGILGQLNQLPAWVLLLLFPIGYAFVLGDSFLISWGCYQIWPLGVLIGRPQPARLKPRIKRHLFKEATRIS